MIFGPTATRGAAGAILAHSLAAAGLSFKKGRVLSDDDVAQLLDAGVEEIVCARLEPDDVHEDQAAGRLAAALAGPGLKTSAAFTGRSNLIAERRGLLTLDQDRLSAVNQIDEAVTLATLPPFATVEPRQMVATLKIIPFSVPEAVLERGLAVCQDGGPLLGLAEFHSKRVGLIQTELPGTREKVLAKGKAVLDARLAALGCPAAIGRRCGHDEREIEREIAALRSAGCELLLIAGASAIVDRGDVVPAGLVRAGGTVEHFGMPVDPGNLLLTGRIEETPVLGLPGCARSPKLNGFDWVLQRLVADLPVTRQDIMAMGAGGLLKETGARPLPRAEAVEAEAWPSARAPARAPRVAAVILAAGRSSRMGRNNKLLADIGGTPMVAKVVNAVVNCSADPRILVTGHEADRVARVVDHKALTLVHNPDYASGLSSSLHRGLAALPEEIDAVVVCLGDMPGISAAVIDKLIAAFDPVEGRAICVPTWQGKRGNPVLLSRHFIPEIQALSGDVGARALLGEHPDQVAEVAMDEDSVFARRGHAGGSCGLLATSGLAWFFQIPNEVDDPLLRLGVAQQIVVSGLRQEERRFGLSGGVEKSAPEAHRDDAVTLTVQDQQRRRDPIHPRQRIPTVEDEVARRQHPIAALRHRGDRAVGRFQNHPRDRALGGVLDREARPEGFAVEHQPIAADAPLRQPVQQLPGIRREVGLGRLARVAAIAAISHEDQAETLLDQETELRHPVADVSGVAVKHHHHRSVIIGRRLVPMHEIEAVAGGQGDLAETGQVRRGQIDRLLRARIHQPRWKVNISTTMTR